MLTTMDKNQFDNIGYGFCIDASPITTFSNDEFFHHDILQSA